MKFPIKALVLFASAVSNVLILKTTAAAAAAAAEPQDHAETTAKSVHPMPPNPEPYQVSYSDGTKSPLIQIKVRGALDSSTHLIYEETLDGYTVKPPVKKGGKYTYLDVDDTTGEMFDTGLIVGVDDPVNSKLRKEAAKKSIGIKESKKVPEEKSIFSSRNLRGNVEQHGRRTAITTGTLKNLVIPFKFSDHTTRTLPSQAQLNTLMNNVGPNASICPTGSVRDVYELNSFGQLDLQSTVINWVTLDYTEAQCAAGQSGLSTMIHTCLANALDKAVAAGVNFGDYDLDNNGIMDGMTFIHSGYAAEWGGTDAYGASNSNRIWSHKWAIYTQNWNNNGVRVYEYHINPAVWSTSGSNIGRIGVIAHETGHFLGLPDLYDYGDATYGDGSGIGSYGLMANSWGFDNSQYYPPLMSAWSKIQLGWVTPTNISTSGSYSLRQACDNKDMIIINAGYPSGEYLLIENRQPCGTEQAMTQGGLAIFHIDDNANNIRGYPGQGGWPTNGNHYEVALLQADGSYNLEKNNNRGDSTDLFHAGGVHSIGPNGISSGAAYPNTKAYQNGNVIDTDVLISNISAAGGTMTFDVTIGSTTSAPTSSRVPTTSPTASPTAEATEPVPSVSPTASTVPSVSPTDFPTTEPVPSASPSAAPSRNDPTEILHIDGDCTDNFASGKCPICTGDCDRDSDCADGLRCVARELFDGFENVPGCNWGANTINTWRMSNWDYCFLPTSQPGVVNYVGECFGYNYLCDLCEGDCDYDSDCAGDLICLQRDGFEAVPGCSGEGGARDVYAKDICVDRQASLSPSALPSASPSVSISASPSASPSSLPSASPIDAPSTSPTYQLVYSIDGPKTNSGQVEFKESESLSAPEVAFTGWDPLTRQYTFEVILPSTVTCPINLVSGKTFYFLLAGACFRAQLYSGGTVERDGKDTVCSSATFNSQGIFSLFRTLNLNSNQAVFDVGPLGYSGKISFMDSTSVSELSAQVKQFDPSLRTFNVEVKLPSESCRATSAADE